MRAVSGLAVSAIAGGVVVAYSGYHNSGIVEGLRALISGNAPPSHPASPTTVSFVDNGAGAAPAPGGGGTPAVPASTGTGNARIADVARSKLGAPYVFGAAGPTTFDCSGLVVWVLRQCGISVSRLTTTGFLVWSGARTIGRGDCAAGDLVCWSSHMGIALDRETMIHAPHTGTVVQTSRIWGEPTPTIRRVVMPGTAV